LDSPSIDRPDNDTSSSPPFGTSQYPLGRRQSGQAYPAQPDRFFWTRRCQRGTSSTVFSAHASAPGVRVICRLWQLVSVAGAPGVCCSGCDRRVGNVSGVSDSCLDATSFLVPINGCHSEPVGRHKVGVTTAREFLRQADFKVIVNQSIRVQERYHSLCSFLIACGATAARI